MKFYFRFAWRNLWRNKRRTLIATSSIFFAVVMALIMRSMQFGSYEYMIKNTVSLYTGYLQLQGKEYWENRSFDESFEVHNSLLPLLQSQPHIALVNPRLETVALLSHHLETRVSPVVGIDPQQENRMTNLQSRIVKGTYLTDSSQGILMAEGLAERLQVTVGDSVIVFGQGYQGVTAAEQIVVEGIIQYPLPQLNNAMIFLALPKAQILFNAKNRLTSVAMMIDDAKKLYELQSALSHKIDSSLVIMNWEEMTPEIVQAIEMDNAGGILMLLILYVIIGFGVFGTVMMMTIERTREFGLLIALGMKREKLLIVSTIETIFVSMVGAIAGMIGAIPLIAYYHAHPIRLWGEAAEAMLAWGLEPLMPFSNDPMIFVAQTIVVFFLALVMSLYPLFFIRKLRPVSAMQGRGGVR